MAENCMIEVTLVSSYGALAEWGSGQIAPVAPPLSAALPEDVYLQLQTSSSFKCLNTSTMSMYTTPIFITEALCLDTYVQLF